MSRGLVVFLSITGMLLLSHLVIGLCAARLMARSRRLLRILVVLFFLLLPFTFGLAWSWNRRCPGPGPSLLHVFDSVWLAFVIHFLLAWGMAWLVGVEAGLAGRKPDLDRMIKAAGILGLVLTIAGFINAKLPRERHLVIPVRDLPAEWEGRRIVHLSDVHLGAIHGKGFLDRLVRKVNRLDPDIVVITGDLFDIFVTDPQPFVEGLSRFRSRKGVYFVTGNHEVHVGVGKVLRALGRTGILVLDGRVVRVDGLQLAGVGYQPEDLGQARMDPFRPGGGYDRDVPCVLLFHTPTGIDGPPEAPSSRHLNTYFSPRTDFSFVREAGVDVQLSGHTHAGQTFPFTLLTRRLFGGYAAGLHRMGDFSLYTSAGTGTWGPPVRLGTTPEIGVIRLQRK